MDSTLSAPGPWEKTAGDGVARGVTQPAGNPLSPSPVRVGPVADAARSSPTPAYPASTAQQRSARWSLQLLGRVDATAPDPGAAVITRWPSRAAAALLARLALAPDRAHAREELVELLWPGVALDIGRNRLRQVLSVLRTALQSGADDPGAEVIDVDRMWLRLRPGMLVCDVPDFECHAAAGETRSALRLYRGEFMPGFYDEWIVQERNRLACLHDRLLALPSSGPGNDGRLTVDGAVASRVGAAVFPRPERIGAPAASHDAIPRYLTRCFGGNANASRLLAQVLAQRLVTVHGPGGSGKTRLAASVARQLRDAARQPDGAAAARFELVLYAPLNTAATSRQMLDALVAAMQGAGASDSRERIVALLTGRQVLLVRDNAEMLDAAAEAAVAELLAELPLAHALLTSRRLTGLDGEAVFELDGLALPCTASAAAGGMGSAAENAQQSPAVAMFVERARAARADAQLAGAQLDAVVEIVRLLGGMPLAIELASSRIATLDPAELLQRLVGGAGTPMLDLLARPARRASADVRHASMRHMLGFSWQHLTPAQDRLLQRMSVLQAPADASLLSRVTGLEMADLQCRIDELHNLSLVLAVHGGSRSGSSGGNTSPGNDSGGATAYSLLAPVRQFAAERCTEDDARDVRSRLRRCLLSQARRITTPAERLQSAKNPHLQQALETAPDDGEPQAGMELVVAIHGYWAQSTLSLVTIQALEKMVELTADRGADPGLRADVLDLLAWARMCSGDGKQALLHLEAALALAAGPESSALQPVESVRRGILLMRHAWVRYATGHHDEQVERSVRDALALVEAAGDLRAQEMMLRMLAMVRVNLHQDYASADTLISRCQAIGEQLGDATLITSRLVDRATIWGWMGRGGDAIQMFRHLIAQGHVDGHQLGLMTWLRQLGRVLVRERRWSEAAEALRESIRMGWEQQNTLELTVALLHLPDALVHLGQLQAAARLQGFAWARWHQLFGKLNRIEAREFRCTRRLLRLRLGAVESEYARVAGVAESYAAAVALALSTDSRSGSARWSA